MNTIEVFDFQEQAVRAVEGPDGEWWFVGKDVCAALDHGNHRQALSRLGEDEKGVHNVDTLGGNQEVTIISEPGCYRLVFTSRTEKAEAFKRWLAHDVLPALRRTGRYEMPSATPAQSFGPEVPVFGVASNMEALRFEMGAIKEGRIIYGPAFAQWLWGLSGLPQPPMAEQGDNPVDGFTEARVYAAAGCVVPARTMYLAYTAWCAEADRRPLTEKGFAAAMLAAGFAKDKGRVRTYLDVALSAAE